MGTYLDRDGTERERHDDPPAHDPLCDGAGFLITGTEDHPVPCLDCRPHLRPLIEHRRRRAAELARV